LLAICSGEEGKARVFGGLRKKKAKGALADEETTVPMRRFIAQDWGDELVVCTGVAFTLWSNRGTYGKKTEDELADSRCADEKVKG